MIHENYCTYHFNNDPIHQIRKELSDKWNVSFNHKKVEKIHSFKEEVLTNCEYIFEDLKSYTSKINVFLSGGTDSECMVRCFTELNIPIQPIIIIHTFAEGSEETQQAFSICKELNLQPKIFKLNLLEIYYSGKFHDLGKKYQIKKLAMLELLYVLEQLQEPAIITDEIHLTLRSSDSDLLNGFKKQNQEWFYELFEEDDGVYHRFEHLNNIPIISDFFKYTPQSWAAMILTENIKQILQKNSYKASSLSTKNLMMSNEFNIRNREKTTIFLTKPFSFIRERLREEIQKDLFPFHNIYIRYDNLLNILGAI